MPRSWLRLPRRTARLRLTLLYGGLFLVCGAVLLAIIYTLERSHTPLAPIRPGRTDTLLHAQPARGGRHSGRQPTRGARLPGAVLLPPAQNKAEAQKRAALEAQARQRAADLNQLLVGSGIALVGMALVSGALGWLVAGRVLSPLRRITGTARAISARNLGERLGLDGPDDEFTELGDTLDELFARLQSAFEGQRHFVANASHELRTPLSWQRSLLEVALADPDPTIESFRCMCEELLVASDQQQRLIEALLTLASSESALEDHEPVDLDKLTQQVLLAQREEIDRQHLDIRATIKPATAIGDPRLIERLITNLIQNAVHHNLPGGDIKITTTTHEQQALFSVANSGHVIPPGEVQRLFEPFQRLNDTRTGNENRHGLGLSIVHAIATAHNAALTAQPHADGGLTVKVAFPARPADPKQAAPPPDRANRPMSFEIPDADSRFEIPTPSDH